MSAIAVSLIVFACVFGGAMLGMFLRARLPEHHQSADSQRIINLGAGIIGTMAALVLGLLVASAKGTYDTQSNELITVAARSFCLIEASLFTARKRMMLVSYCAVLSIS